LRSVAIERLYLVAAIAIGCDDSGQNVQIVGLRLIIDPHWQRGLSYSRIGLRWQSGRSSQRTRTTDSIPLLPKDPQPAFASKQAERDFYDQVWFSRIR